MEPKQNFNSLIIMFFIFILSVSCNQSKSKETATDYLDQKGFDSTVRPQNDFFNYANGTWIKNTDIPASESSWGTGGILYQNTTMQLRSLLDSCARAHATKGSNEQKIGDFFTSAMDSAGIEQKGINPLVADLQRISSLQDKRDILNEVAREYKSNLSPLINFYANQDDKNSDVIAAHFDQGGLGLPNRDYYLNKDSATNNIRNHYVQYIGQLFQLAGDDSLKAQKEAASVMRIEYALAKSSKSPVDLRDPEANYHKKALVDLNKQMTSLNWNILMDSFHVKQDSLIIGQPAFYKSLNGLLSSVPVDDWKNYLRFHYIDSYAPYLNNAFVISNFNMNKLLTGQKELQPRWKRMVALTDAQLGDALGKLYVNKFFPPEAKERILSLVNNLQETYKERIQSLNWMSDSTKRKAIVKLEAIRKKIGYPDKFKDYSLVEINNYELIENIKQTGQFLYKFMIDKIGKPVDRSEWFMTPPTIDAYYSPYTNDINFPAGILQPPFFYKDGDDALNYGAIGVVIGHEMTHGFDDQGRLYDDKGNLKNWWLSADSTNFSQKAKRVIKQYNESVVLDSLHINGELTQGENIADIGGLTIAYEAFKKTKQGKSNEKISGLTSDQRFFLAYAEVWRNKMRPERLRSSLLNNPHSTPMYRVNNPVSDITAFYKAFNVKPGDKMYRLDSVRAQVW